MVRHINQLGLDLVKQWEGLRTDAYQDVAGIWTIGYGHTAAAGAPAPFEGLKITPEKAEEILQGDLGQYEQGVDKAVKVGLNDNQFSALVSFAYNVGIGNFQKSSLLKKLNSGDYDSVPAELMKWTYSGGVQVRGLINRRAAEAGLWAKGDFVASNYVRPDNKKENGLIKPETIGPVVGSVAGLAGFVTGHGPFQWALALIMVLGCCAGAWYFIQRLKKENT